MTRGILVPSGLAITLFFAQAQTANRFALSVDNIMRGPGLVGYEPSQVRWSHDSSRLFFQWKQAADPQDAPYDTYNAARDGAAPRKLTDEEAKAAPPGGGDTSRDRRLTVYARDGDLFVYDNSTGATRQVTRTSDTKASPRFMRDSRRISFTRAGNLYVMSLDTGMLEQMTDVRSAAADGAPVTTTVGGRGGRGGGVPPTASGDPPARGTDSQEYLKKEQKELLETVRQRAARREQDEARRKIGNPRKPFTLQARQSVTSLQLSPDEKHVIAAVAESGGGKNTMVPNFITESAYVEDIPGRTNAGDTQSSIRLAVIDVASGDFRWIDHGQKKTPPSEQPRDLQLRQPVWSEDGARAVILARSADNKNRWIFALDPATGKLRAIASDHDDAWLGGPGTMTLGWMLNDREVFFQSERSGYSHLYAVPYEGGEARALTSGKWEVLGVRQSRDRSQFYITASKDSPYENHLYRMSAGGGPLTRITRAPGKHVTTLSPDEKWIADIYSYTNKPPELYVQESRPEAEPKKLTTSPAPEFGQFPWLDAPVIEFPARDGARVSARLFKPAAFRKGGPAVVFVHGAGYLQNVDRWWSSNYFREYMFHHILMERGYLVIEVDYRGSAGYGRDWRTAIYRHMGGKDLDDIVDAARYVVSQHGVNPKKIGLFGGSYGGFITLMALFTQPDSFAAGAALRPVSDWALYNHGYTSDILNLPQGDPEAYRRSSPIYFAQGLKGALLLCHGMVDTNVEFEDTVRLVQKLIELRKENWELAVYPVENHGFVEPSSWADEYRRILALFEKNLR